MKWQETLLYVALLGFAIAAVSMFFVYSWTPRDTTGFYSLLTFLGTILLVYVTARYVFVFERDSSTRQAIQEEWEIRRFHAGRLFLIADGFVDLFFASKRELEVFLGEWTALLDAQERSVLQAAFSAAVPANLQQTPATIRVETGARIEAARIRYNERAKDYHWRAQALIHQAKTVVSPEHYQQITAMFTKLSAEFDTREQGYAVLKAYSDSYESFADLVRAVRDVADSKLRVKQTT